MGRRALGRAPKRVCGWARIHGICVTAQRCAVSGARRVLGLWPRRGGETAGQRRVGMLRAVVALRAELSHPPTPRGWTLIKCAGRRTRCRETGDDEAPGPVTSSSPGLDSGALLPPHLMVTVVDG